MDMIVWQPLSTWAEKFKYEFAASSGAVQSLGMFDALSGVGPAVTRALRIDPGAAHHDASAARSRRVAARSDDSLPNRVSASGAIVRTLIIGAIVIFTTWASGPRPGRA